MNSDRGGSGWDKLKLKALQSEGPYSLAKLPAGVRLSEEQFIALAPELLFVRKVSGEILLP